MSLQAKITLGSAAAMLAAALVTLFLNIGMFRNYAAASTERELLDIAGVVAQFPEVVLGLRGSPYNGVVQSRVRKVLAAVKSVDEITVCDMHRIRYSHNNPEFIGMLLEGDDFKEVLYQAKRYVATVPSPDDASGGFMRAYAPVFDGTEQIGFVIAGAPREKLENSVGNLSLSAVVFMLAGLCAGMIGAVIIAHRASKNLLGLEPEEITQVYREHAGLMEAMHEGVVAINSRGRISFINASARKLLDLGDRQVDGLEIDLVMPNPRLPSVIATGEAVFEYEKRINNRLFIANMVPVKENDRVVGAVETFQDRTQLIRMAQELTGIRQLVEALRANSHEFSNKLHVVLGLLELGDYEQAKKYVQSAHSDHGKLHTKMLRTFKEPMIAGLMLGKVSVAKEQGVDLLLNDGSGLAFLLPAELSHSLVLILGNLIDNAVESARNNPGRDGTIRVDIRGDARTIYLQVEDNGAGIAPGNLEIIFRRGFSTKGEGRGTGLHLVRQEIGLLGGSVDATSAPGRTVFSVRLPVSATETET